MSISHWLIAKHRQPNTMMCLVVDKTAETACGRLLKEIIGIGSSASYVPTSHINCFECMQTPGYQDTLITIEIAYNGNAYAWWQEEKLNLPVHDEDQ